MGQIPSSFNSSKWWTATVSSRSLSIILIMPRKIVMTANHQQNLQQLPNIRLPLQPPNDARLHLSKCNEGQFSTTSSQQQNFPEPDFICVTIRTDLPPDLKRERGCLASIAYNLRHNHSVSTTITLVGAKMILQT